MFIHASEALVFWKSMIALMAGLIVWHVWSVSMLGRAMAHSGTAEHTGALKSRLWCMGSMLAITLLMLGAYDSAVPHAVSSGLLAFHLTFVALAVLSFAAILYFTGVRDRATHKRLVYFFLPCFAALAISGAVMWYNLPTHF
jgi:hypothetical protein